MINSRATPAPSSPFSPCCSFLYSGTGLQNFHLRQYGVNPVGLKAAAAADAILAETKDDELLPCAPPPSNENRLEKKAAHISARSDSQQVEQQQQHQQQHQQEGRDSLPVVEIRVCNTCGKAFSSEGFLKKHITRRHPDLLEKETIAEVPANCSSVRDNGGEGTRGDGDIRHRSPETEARHDNDDGEQQKLMDSSAAGYDGEEADKEGKGDKRPRAPRTNGRRDDEEGTEEDVEEGARRLGELVRERETARFRSELEALRKEIQDLKVSSDERTEHGMARHKMPSSL